MVNMHKTYVLLISVLCIMSCNPRLPENYQPDIQGHRGCRGLMPENTIEGFIHAVYLGVSTLELDVVISKDSQVVVSHEPFFNHLISTSPPGTDSITPENEKQFNLFTMDYDEIRRYDTGSKDHPDFPIQSKIKTFKPTLGNAVVNVEQYILAKGLNPVRFNIEIKHKDESEGIFNPTADKMVQLVYLEVLKLKIKDQCCIQSFNPKCLNIMHALDSTIQTALLVENMDYYRKNLSKLTFKPTIYSPHFKLINKELLKDIKTMKIKVIPWTVNEENDIIQMLKLQVDGIISDYPDKVIELLQGLK